MLKPILRGISYFLGLASLVASFVIIILLIINPKFKQLKPQAQPRLKVYLDNSQSVFQYQKEIKSILKNMKNNWSGSVEIKTFSSTLSKKTYGIKDIKEMNYFEKPTYFNPVAKRLLFSPKEEKNLIITDFIWSDGVKLSKSENIHYLNLTDFLIENNTLDSLPTGAGIFLNQDFTYNSDLPVTIKLLFYHKNKNVELNYELQRIMGNRTKKVLAKKKIFIKEHYLEINERIKFDQAEWVHLKVKIIKPTISSEDKIIEDSINIYPKKKKKSITFIYFKPTKDGQAMKNALEKYQFFEINNKYFFKSKKLLDIELRKLIGKSKLFFLVSPPIEVISFFRRNKLSFIHLPNYVNSNKNTKFNSGYLKFKYPFNNFLGEVRESINQWDLVAHKLYGQALNPKKVFPNKEIILYQGNTTNSYFFGSRNELYLGIKDLHKLNNRFAVSQEESLLDLFMVRLVQYFWDQLNQNKLNLHNNNFFLGEQIHLKKLIKKLPNLIKLSKKNSTLVYINPKLNMAGSYPSKNNSPPYNYRISYKEYLPGANYQPYRSSLSIADQEKKIWENLNIKKLVEIEVNLRDDHRVYFLLLIFFILFLISKWFYFKFQT